MKSLIFGRVMTPWCAASALIASAIISVGFSAPVAAQGINPFQSVENRSRPEFESPPIIVGNFEVSPRISSDIEYVDNLFATDQMPVNDVVLRITPSVSIRDQREDRALALRLSTGYETYLDNQVDDRFQLRARGNGRFGLGTATRPFLGFNVSRNDSRGSNISSFSEVEQPLRLTRYGGNLGVEQDIGNFTLTGEGLYRATEFDGALTVDGMIFDSGLRDSEIYTGRGRLAYSRDQVQSFYIEASYNKRDFSGPTLGSGLPATLLADRSSDGFSVRVGFTRRLTEVLQLDLNAGYLRQEFDDPAFSTISSLSFDGSLFWSPTRLTTIQARASRTVDATSDPIFNGLLRTEFSLAVQHELRRDFILTGEAQYASIDVSNQSNNGSEYSISGSARYLLSPHWSVKLRGEVFERNVVFPGSQKRILFGVQYNF